MAFIKRVFMAYSNNVGKRRRRRANAQRIFSSAFSSAFYKGS